MNETNNSDQHVADLLSEILRWTKIGALNLREALAQELATDQQRLAYELTNGVRSSRDVASQSGVSFVTVTNWWRRWSDLGFVDPSPKYPGRVQRLCSLRMLGIPVPEEKTRSTTNRTQLKQPPAAEVKDQGNGTS